jgi:uncharacterized membrane protein YdfJ with MMPL/SSD domain
MLTSFAALVGSRPRRTLLAVLLFVLAAGALGGSVADRLESGEGGFAPADADSIRAVERLEEATGRQPSPGIVVLLETPAGPAAASERIDEVAADLRARPGVASVAAPDPAASDGAGLVAPDGSAALVVATLTADADEETVAEGVLAAFEGAEDVTVGGEAIAITQIRETINRDLGRAELYALPLLVVLSLLFFGGRAALLPVIVGATTVLGTFLALSAVNEVYGLSIFALNLVIGLGLGLAIDYTLFLVTRYREELARQGPGHGAIRTTMATAGRTVVYSALTVAVALITLTTFPMGFLRSMGIAGALVALVAAAASLVVSPALFGLWGTKLARRRTSSGGAGRWYRLSHAVMRRPGAVAAVTALLMLALSAPALRAEWTPVDDTVIPQDESARIVSDRIADDFGGTGTTPVTIAVEGGSSAEVAEYAGRLGALEGVVAPAAPQDLGGGIWQLDLAVAGDAAGPAARQLVDDVRAVDTSLNALVAGPAADFADQQGAMSDSLPLAVTLLVLLTLLVLWLMTGSVILPLKAVAMNVLTVGVALGALTFVYQDGRLTGLLGYTPNGGIEPTDFLVAAALVFALSTDYGVFLLGRIKESRDAGLGEREAVAVGLERTGSVVTAAAILLAVAIGAFSTSEISFIQQIGVATAVGVLVDAFVVRSLLVPSLMGLLGKWNWWAPMPLRRLHDRFGLSESEPAGPVDDRPLVPSSTP